MSNRARALNRTERLFALVLLLQNRPSMTSRALAVHFDVSRRTIFRDLHALSESGVPLTYAEEGGYEILEGYQLPPLMLSGRQAATLLVGAEFMKLQADASLRKEADQVALKIRSVLPSPVREYIDRLNERTVLDPYWLHQGPAEDEGFWYDLSEAVAQRRSVIMDYVVQSRDELTKRRVNPLGLVFYTDHWNLIAFDHVRQDIRSFLLENIQTMFVTSSRFTPPEGFTLKEYLKDRGESRRNLRIELRFAAPAYRWARRGIPAEIESERQEEGHVTVTFYFENLSFLTRYLLRFGAQVRVIEPDALRQRLRAMALSLAETHRAS